MTPVVLLMACSGIPASIPRTPGTIDELVLPDLLSVATPDLPNLLLATFQQLAYEDFRECPTIDTFGGVSVTANGCTDSAQIEWDGSAFYTETNTLQSFSFTNLEWSGFAGAWSATGTIDITPYVLNLGGYEMRSKIALNSLDGSELEMWIDTTGSVTYAQDNNPDDGVDTSGRYVDTYTGTVGLQSWGLAELEALRVPFAQSIGCGYANSGAGSMRIIGKNEAQVYFLRGDDVLTDGGSPPVRVADTALPDTAVDTDVSGPSGFDFGSDEDSGLCGTCATALIDDVSVPECVLVNRTLAFPFVSPW